MNPGMFAKYRSFAKYGQQPKLKLSSVKSNDLQLLTAYYMYVAIYFNV